MKRIFTLLASFSFLINLQSQEWVRQHPFEGFAPLQAITFDENGNGWTVGEKSLILHTSNWGELWSIQKGIESEVELAAVEIIPGTNSQTVVAAGDGVFITRDNGNTWDQVDMGESIDGVYRIQAFDENNWIVSSVAKGAKTNDGGETWTFFAMPDNSANGAWFTDLNNGWAGSGPFGAQQIFKTINGGIDWTLADDDVYPVITDISMINTQTGFMSARDFIYKTTDGGSSWTKMHDDVQPSLLRMHVVNENIIWSGLNNGFVFFTLNGGVDWQQINPNLINSNSVTDVFATDDGRAWVPGKYASIQYTADNGLTWEDQTPGSKNSLFDVEFRGNIGVAAGSEGMILLTSDGGAIWENISYDPLSSYLALSLYTFQGEGHVYLGSTSGKVVHRVFPGTSWETIGENLGDINAIHAINDQVLFVGTYTNILRTLNGGAEWDTVASTSDFVGEFSFPAPQIGYAAIKDGRILKTTDSGTTWLPVLERNTSYKFSGLHFHDANLGWAVAELKDSVFITADGGDTWNSFKLPRNTFWQDIQFMDQDTGYISGGSAGSGIILRTNDGGETWKVSFNESDRLNRMFVRLGEEYVWVVGFGGNILHFSPCVITPAVSNLTGEESACEGDIVVYEVNSEAVTVFNWTVPPGWTIIGNDNSAHVEILVGLGDGVISIQGENSCGTVTSALSINVISHSIGDVVIEEQTGTLSTSVVNVTYQWLLEGEEIPGANGSSFNPEVSGNYSLIVTSPEGCTNTSNTIFVMISGIHDESAIDIRVHPNPAGDFIELTHDQNVEIDQVIIYNQHGQVVASLGPASGRINLSAYAGGFYTIQLITKTGVHTRRFIRT